MSRRLMVALLALAVLAPTAQAGKRISKAPNCPDQTITYSKKNAERYRAALLCLMSFIRDNQGMNKLHKDAKLQKAGQKWANVLGQTGETTHGKSVAEIPKRIAKAGYKAQALNEGLGLGPADNSPYDLMSNMMTDYACTEILDPRFRDAGVGVNLGKIKGFGRGVHVVVEFGLKVGAKQPSRKTTPAKTCSHALPHLVVKQSPAGPLPVSPTVKSDRIIVPIGCSAKTACTFDATVKLTHQGAATTVHVDGLKPNSYQSVTFMFDPAAIKAEKASKNPHIDLKIHSTAPYDFMYSDGTGI